MGYELDADELSQLYKRFIKLTDRKKEVFEDDLRVIIASLRDETFETYHLVALRTSGGDPTMALVKLQKGDETFADTATGDGPVDAACMAVERITGISGKLTEFSVRAATPGKDALGDAHVTVEFEGKAIYGHGDSTDIIEAAVMAYLNALNKFLALKTT